MGPHTLLLDTAESKEREERRKKFSRNKDEDETPSGFELARRVTRKKLSLPRGVRIAQILTEQSPEPITTGKAYTHFFPNGIIEQSILYLEDNQKNKLSLVIRPLVGKTQVMTGHVSREAAFGR